MERAPQKTLIERMRISFRATLSKEPIVIFTIYLYIQWTFRLGVLAILDDYLQSDATLTSSICTQESAAACILRMPSFRRVTAQAARNTLHHFALGGLCAEGLPYKAMDSAAPSTCFPLLDLPREIRD